VINLFPQSFNPQAQNGDTEMVIFFFLEKTLV